MKHILNDLSEEEKNSIRKQHTGGIKVMTENFNKLINSKLGDAKPLVEEIKLRQPVIDRFYELMDDPENNPNNFSDEFEYVDSIISYFIYDLLEDIPNIPDTEMEKMKIFFKKEIGEVISDRYHLEVGDSKY